MSKNAITAEEAMNKVRALRIQNMDTVYNVINDAIAARKTEANYYKNLEPEAIKTLLAQGYRLEKSIDRNELCFTIKFDMVYNDDNFYNV